MSLVRGLRWVFDRYFYAERKIVPLSPELYDQYAGLYEHAEEKLKVTMYGKDNVLVHKTEEGKEEIKFFPGSESDFFAKKEKLQLAFHQEKKKAAGFVIQGKNTRFKRVALRVGKK
jgi:hypothetical protein